MSQTFGARLHAAATARGPLCVGIDPHASLLEAWGLPDSAYGLEQFTMTVVEALAGQVAMLKPQSAFFERHGSAGSRCSSGRSPPLASRVRWCCWTPSAVTSARRRAPTRTRTSARPRRSPWTRSP
jgi:hypothetical protein